MAAFNIGMTLFSGLTSAGIIGLAVVVSLAVGLGLGLNVGLKDGLLPLPSLHRSVSQHVVSSLQLTVNEQPLLVSSVFPNMDLVFF